VKNILIKAATPTAEPVEVSEMLWVAQVKKAVTKAKTNTVNKIPQFI
jgi:hypothetical protein